MKNNKKISKIKPMKRQIKRNDKPEQKQNKIQTKE